MNGRSRAAVVLAASVAAVVMLSATAGAASIPYPTSPNATVLRIAILGAPGSPGGPSLAIRGDGTAVIQTALRGPGSASPEPLVFRVKASGIEKVLRAARAAGLLRRTDYGQATVGDHSTTVVQLDAAGHRRTVRVDSLRVPASDTGLSPTVQTARRALRAFTQQVTTPSFYDGVRR